MFAFLLILKSQKFASIQTLHVAFMSWRGRDSGVNIYKYKYKYKYKYSATYKMSRGANKCQTRGGVDEILTDF